MRQRLGDHGSGGPSTLQTADRALQILQLFASPKEAIGVTEIARRLGIHRSSASRLVATLQSRRFLERAPAGQGLRLGVEVQRLGRLALVGRDLAAEAQPVLDWLAEQTGETATLATPMGDQVTTVAQAASRHFVSSGKWIGVRAAPHCCADGKVLLAFGAIPADFDALSRQTPSIDVDPEALGRELGEVRTQGYALAVGELEEGLVGMAVPVFEDHACVAALCISGPAYRLGPGAGEALLPVCARAQTVLEQRMRGGVDAVAEHDDGSLDSTHGHISLSSIQEEHDANLD